MTITHSPEEIATVLRYDAETGKLWRIDSGREVGCKAARYLVVRVFGRLYLAHRLAWALHHGRWPERLDHRNRDTHDNRIENLREATPVQNSGNTPMYRCNRTGFKGVFLKPNGKFSAQIRINGKQKHLGYFVTAEEAHAVYVKAAKEHFGEFARAA